MINIKTISDIKAMWEPNEADVHQGHMKHIEMAVERDEPLRVPLRGLAAPSWWTSCRIFTEDPTAFFRVSIACNNGNGPVLETWVQPSCTLSPLTWPIPGDLARALELTLIVRYVGGERERTAVALTLGFHELDGYDADERFAFVDAVGRPIVLWDARFGTARVRGADDAGEAAMYVIVPRMNRLLNDARWQDIHCILNGWNDALAL